MKVCFIVGNANQYGGIERVFSLLSSYMADTLGYDVKILSLYTRESKLFYEISNAVKIRNVGLSLGADVRRAMINEFVAEPVDCVITMHPTIALDFCRIKRKLPPMRWIATEHSFPLDYSNKRRLANLYTYLHSDKLVVLTEAAAKYYKMRGERNVEIIPNPLTFESDEVSSLQSNEIVAVGRLEKVKRYDLLISAFAKAHNLYPKWKLKLVGDGSERQELIKQAEELGLNDAVIFTGIRRDIKDIMLKSSMLAITSTYEGFSLVALEAIACGLPIVSVGLPAIKEIDAGTGAVTFAKEANSTQFAEKMRILMGNPDLLRKSAAEARKRSSAYRIDVIGQKWKQLIEGNK